MRWLVVAVLLLVAGCSQDPTAAAGRSVPAASPSPASPHPASPSPVRSTATPAAPVKAGDPYLGLARTLHRHGVAVWFEADLVKAWQSGPAALRAAAVRLGQLARGTDVTGFKIADELGYGDGIRSASEGVRFLHDADAAMQRTAPGKPLLVDAVVPDLGCLPWIGGGDEQACAARARATYPAADMAALTRYLGTGAIDRLDLSTGLLDESTYAAWGTSLARAQQEAWQHARDLGWGELTMLQSRKALAAAGGYQGGADQAAADLRTWVDVPLESGARAVDVWTWRQPYDGATVSLLPSSLRPNALWTGLESRHAAGAAFLTHMTPSAMPSSPGAVDRECAVVARAFSAIFVAAGTG